MFSINNLAISDLIINLHFDNYINIIDGDSSTGKTLVGKLLQQYYTYKGNNSTFQYYDNTTIKDLNLEGYSVFIFDKADFYVTKPFIENLLKHKNKTYIFYGRALYDLYKLGYSRYELVIKENTINSIKIS